MTDTYTPSDTYHSTVELPNSSDTPSAAIIVTGIEAALDNAASAKARIGNWRLIGYYPDWGADPSPDPTLGSSDDDTFGTSDYSIDTIAGALSGDWIDIEADFNAGTGSSCPSGEWRLSYKEGSGAMTEVPYARGSINLVAAGTSETHMHLRGSVQVAANNDVHFYLQQRSPDDTHTVYSYGPISARALQWRANS